MIQYKDETNFWKYPTKPKLLDILLETPSGNAEQRRNFVQIQIQILQKTCNHDIKALIDAHRAKPDFDLMEAERTLYSEMEKLAHNLLGATNERLLNKCNPEVEERLNLLQLKKKWTIQLAKYLAEVIVNGPDLNFAQKVVCHVIQNHFQKEYIAEREAIKQLYRIDHKYTDQIHATDSNLLLVFEKQIVPKCKKKMKERQMRHKIKAEIRKVRAGHSTTGAMKRLLSIGDLSEKNRSRAGSSTPSRKQKVPEVANEFDEIDRFLEERSGHVDVRPIREEVANVLDSFYQGVAITSSPKTPKSKGDRSTPKQTDRTFSPNHLTPDETFSSKGPNLNQTFFPGRPNVTFSDDGPDNQTYSSHRPNITKSPIPNQTFNRVASQGNPNATFLPDSPESNQTSSSRRQNVTYSTDSTKSNKTFNQTFSNNSAAQESLAFRKPRVKKFIRDDVSHEANLTSENVLQMTNESESKVSPVKRHLIRLLPIWTMDDCVAPSSIPTSKINGVNEFEMEQALIESGGWFDMAKVKTDYLTLDDLKICDIVEPELNTIDLKIDANTTTTEYLRVVDYEHSDRVQLRGTPDWYSGNIMVFPNEEPQPKPTNANEMLAKAWTSMGATF